VASGDVGASERCVGDAGPYRWDHQLHRDNHNGGSLVAEGEPTIKCSHGSLTESLIAYTGVNYDLKPKQTKILR
jgi:hypothetical protein